MQVHVNMDGIRRCGPGKVKLCSCVLIPADAGKHTHSGRVPTLPATSHLYVSQNNTLIWIIHVPLSLSRTTSLPCLSFPIHTTTPPLPGNTHSAMSTRSSIHKLDREESAGSVLGVRPKGSHAPHPHDSDDGRVDRDYFGQQCDTSDMKVSAKDADRRGSRSTDVCEQHMGKSQRLVRKFEIVSTIGFTSCVMGYVKPELLLYGRDKNISDADSYLSLVPRKFFWSPVESASETEDLLGCFGPWSGQIVANSS
jgi:hypothetical protein